MDADAAYTLFVRTVDQYGSGGRHISGHSSVDAAMAKWGRLRRGLTSGSQVTVAVILPGDEKLGSPLQIDLLSQAYSKAA
jgi:hypothetical protein